MTDPFADYPTKDSAIKWLEEREFSVGFESVRFALYEELFPAWRKLREPQIRAMQDSLEAVKKLLDECPAYTMPFLNCELEGVMRYIHENDEWMERLRATLGEEAGE